MPKTKTKSKKKTMKKKKGKKQKKTRRQTGGNFINWWNNFLSSIDGSVVPSGTLLQEPPLQIGYSDDLISKIQTK